MSSQEPPEKTIKQRWLDEFRRKYMTEQSKSKWWQSMIAKMGSEQAVREFMAASAKEAKHTGGGGFAHMRQHDPKRLKEISKRGGSIGKRTK